jgi:hypothetical protein
MTLIAEPAYVMAVLLLYVDLPDTPDRTSAYDRMVAHSLFQRGVSVEVVESAMLLACLRRSVRPPGAPPLPRIRSLAYFSPVIEELQQPHVSVGYLEYVRDKARRVFQRDVGKNIPSQDCAPR